MQQAEWSEKFRAGQDTRVETRVLVDRQGPNPWAAATQTLQFPKGILAVSQTPKCSSLTGVQSQCMALITGVTATPLNHTRCSTPSTLGVMPEAKQVVGHCVLQVAQSGGK